MIIGAIMGAAMVGGVALAFVAVTFGAVTFAEDRTPLWPTGVLAIVGVALAGAGFGAMIGSWSVHPECPPGTVQADSRNDLFRGCIPLELARKQVEQ